MLAAGKHVVCEKPLAMTSGRDGRAGARWPRASGLVHAVNYNVRFYPLAREARERVARRRARGRAYIVTGSYLQDWLLLRRRLELAARGGPRRRRCAPSPTSARTGSTSSASSPAGASTRSWPTSPRSSRSAGARGQRRDVREPAGHGGDGRRSRSPSDDAALLILLRFEGGARGALTVSQVSAGRKNQLRFELAGADASLAWDTERAEELWIGHRDRPNESLLRDPSLLSAGRRHPARRAHRGLPRTPSRSSSARSTATSPRVVRRRRPTIRRSRTATSRR